MKKIARESQDRKTQENGDNNNDEIEKTPDMKRYEVDTGKYAVWRGVITEGFKKWKEGEKIYDRDKERISLYISEQDKRDWKGFIEEHNYSTISKLIRESVDYFKVRKQIQLITEY